MSTVEHGSLTIDPGCTAVRCHRADSKRGAPARMLSISRFSFPDTRRIPRLLQEARRPAPILFPPDPLDIAVDEKDTAV